MTTAALLAPDRSGKGVDTGGAWRQYRKWPRLPARGERIATAPGSGPLRYEPDPGQNSGGTDWSSMLPRDLGGGMLVHPRRQPSGPRSRSGDVRDLRAMDASGRTP